MPKHPLHLVVLLVVALALPLAACGDKGSSGSSSAQGGAASPEELVKLAKQAAEDEDFGQIIPLILPEHRAAITAFVGILPASFMIGMAEGMSGMAEAGGPEAAKEAKDKIADMKKQWDALLARYQIEMPEDGGIDMAAMGAAKTPEARGKVLESFNGFLGHVDHAAFIRDSQALLEKLSDGKSSSGNNFENFKLENAEITVDGDRATVKMPGEDKPLGLLKRDGRWYIDISTME